MRFISEQITFQEIPEEICLSFMIPGCPLRCPGCHSAEWWSNKKTNSQSYKTVPLLNAEHLLYSINTNKDFITCVLFLGGEWHEATLIQLLKLVKVQGLKTALYTGLENVSAQISQHLDYLKTGPWIESLGGLRSPRTNQRLTHVPTQKQIFLNQNQQGGFYDEAYKHTN